MLYPLFPLAGFHAEDEPERRDALSGEFVNERCDDERWDENQQEFNRHARIEFNDIKSYDDNNRLVNDVEGQGGLGCVFDEAV